MTDNIHDCAQPILASPGVTTSSRRQLEAMVAMAQAILRYTRLDDILAAITRELSNLIDFDRSSIAFMSADGQSLVLQHVYKRGEGAEKIGEGRRISVDENSIIGSVAVNRKPILRSDITTDTRFLEIVSEESLKSDMIVPLVARSRLIGTLNVGSYTPGALGESDLSVLVNCGALTCAAIEHALLLEEAREIGDRYRTLQQHASDIIVVVDKNTGRIVEVNRKCCESLAYSQEELCERSFFELFPAEDQYQAKRDFINILSRKTTAFVDRRLISRDGRIIYVDISASLIAIEADTFIQIMVHDVSQRKMLEQQIILQNKNLQEANKQLRDVDHLKSDFLANISHELRTPLSVIIAYADTSRDSSLEPDQRESFLKVIEENGQHLLRLINDLLDLSKLESSGAMLSVSLSHIHDVVRSVWNDVENMALEKSITVVFKPGYDIPVIYMDNRRMRQVVTCVIQNAIKFTGEGGNVEVSTRLGADRVIIDVADTGAGIPPEEITNIFDAFRQIDGSSTRRWGGLGIGLAIARHLVELHGGTIEVRSRPEKGSVFTIALPVDSEEAFATKRD